MNEMTKNIRLLDLMESPNGWGHEEGREVFSKLLQVVESNPGKRIFRISLDGVARTDASFPRESVMELARRYRGDKGFCLVDLENIDLLDNWESAAEKKEQPIVLWRRDGSHKIIGLQPSKGNAEILELALKVPVIRAADAVTQLDLKLPNASTKLKQLWEQGFLLRREDVAESGGVEFLYFRIQ
ncbi:hypothetical protein [Azospira restricta]|uniref:DNA-binding protein n=1 Tax=Azospira restricta TaxID=404405 RepID=A0A974SQ70_9RHOO|nr:hypothetical protein [Azospira restricta]QRJ64436.1 DNA-binding protein [Azospira restricta]